MIDDNYRLEDKALNKYLDYLVSYYRENQLVLG